MLQSERDAERFYEAQRKFEQRQRMIDKGWGDLEAYNALRASEKKKERIESIRMFLCAVFRYELPYAWLRNMRPLYETQKNLNVERDVASLLEQKWKCHVVKMPIKYGLDYTLTRNKEIAGFCEIKCLNYELAQFDRMSGGYFISLGKFISAKNLVEFTKLPFFLVLKTYQ